MAKLKSYNFVNPTHCPKCEIEWQEKLDAEKILKSKILAKSTECGECGVMMIHLLDLEDILGIELAE